MGCRHQLSDDLLARLQVAWSELRPSEFSAPDSAKAAGSAHLTLLWTVTSNISAGAAFMVGRRINTDDRRGDASRFQLMGKYAF